MAPKKKKAVAPKRPTGLKGRQLDDALRRVQAPTVKGVDTQARQWNRWSP